MDSAYSGHGGGTSPLAGLRTYLRPWYLGEMGTRGNIFHKRQTGLDSAAAAAVGPGGGASAESP